MNAGTKRGRRGRQWLFPRTNGQWFLYAIGRRGGLTKIGVTGCPALRLSQHARGGGIAWVHIFSGYSDRRLAWRIETTALTIAASRGRRIGRTEHFEDLPRAAAIEVVRLAIHMAAVA